MQIPIISRCTKTTCTIDGYTIPNQTQIIFNHGAVHHEEKNFTQAQDFNPHRFLNAAKSFEANIKVCPYGSGSRKCCGEILAKVMIYTAFSAILSRFDIVKGDGAESVSTEPNFRGGMTIPKPYQIKFLPRNIQN